MIVKKCLNCETSFKSHAANHRKFCKHKCSSDFSKGKKRPEQTAFLIKKHKLAPFGFKKGEHTQEDNYFWRGGYAKKCRAWRNSSEGYYWKKHIREKFGDVCQKCGKFGRETHHIKSLSQDWELRNELSNGTVLCKDCHEETDTYGKHK